MPSFWLSPSTAGSSFTIKQPPDERRVAGNGLKKAVPIRALKGRDVDFDFVWFDARALDACGDRTTGHLHGGHGAVSHVGAAARQPVLVVNMLQGV